MGLPEQIGRFQVLEVLGRGSQAVVYLARDPRLDRRVAIKTIRVSTPDPEAEQARLTKEARMVSRLQHPNILPLYEAGEDKGLLYLVFEYVDGTTLGRRRKGRGPLAVKEAIDLMIQILAGIQCAHDQGIVHRDLTPSNILIDRNGLPRIMDFGISLMMGVEESVHKDVSGTPCYMSPEHFSKEPLTAQSDIFSLGLIFYEMVLGRPAVQADNHVAVMYKIASESIPPPSVENPDVDKRLDEVFLRAVEKESALRYPSAQDMRRDLESYLAEDDGSASPAEWRSGQVHGTLDFLLRRIRHQGDFPAFSRNIVEINKKASTSRANMASASELANAILKDLSLTNKLLRLVNSAFYGQFAGTITTLSRAVVILGFEQVRTAASCLLLFEHMKSSDRAGELKDAALGSFMSGMIARELAERRRYEAPEEAFICAMIHNLGRHLVLCYFPEECDRIQSLIASKGYSEAAAVRSVLGLSYEELGKGVARTWRFPEKIVAAMKEIPAGKAPIPRSEVETLQSLSVFSNTLVSDAGEPDPEVVEERLRRLLERFDKAVPIGRDQAGELLQKAKEGLREYSSILGVDLEQSRLMRHLEGHDLGPGTLFETHGASEEAPEIEVPQSLPSTQDEPGEEALLINGIQDITNTLLGEYDLNEVLTMVLETLYRGFRLGTAILCIRDRAKPSMSARIGFGRSIEAKSQGFGLSMTTGPRDVFQLAVAQGKDIHISDALDPRIQGRLPEWYTEVLGDPSFALFPIMVEGRAFGLFFLGGRGTESVFAPRHINYLRTLRNQAVLAVRQKRS